MAIRGSRMTNTVHSDGNRQHSARFVKIVPLLSERLVAPTDTRQEEPIENARNKGCYKCKEIGHGARFCPQNKQQVRSRPQLNKRLNKN